MNLPPIMYRGRFALLWHDVSSPALEARRNVNESSLDRGNSGVSPDLSRPNSVHSNVDSHWDLLLELDSGTLLSWRLASLPTGVHTASNAENLAKRQMTVPAVRLSDHRAIYLDYEGPISGNRGWVTRQQSGHYMAWIEHCEPSAPCQFETSTVLDEPERGLSHKLPSRELSESGWLRVVLYASSLRAEFQVACVPAGVETVIDFWSWAGLDL